MHNVIQIFFRGSDDPHNDRWYIIRTDLIHKDDNFHSVIALFDRVGTHLPQHVLCCPRAYSVSDNLTEKELKEMRDFDPSAYKMFDLQPGEPCVIVGCYMIIFD